MVRKFKFLSKVFCEKKTRIRYPLWIYLLREYDNILRLR